MAYVYEMKLFLDSFGSDYGGMLSPEGEFLPACPKHSDTIENYYDGRLINFNMMKEFLDNEEYYSCMWNAKYDLIYLAGFVHVEWGVDADYNCDEEDEDSNYNEGEGTIDIDCPASGFTPAQQAWIDNLKDDADEMGFDYSENFNSRPYSGIYRDERFDYVFDEEGLNDRTKLREALEAKILSPVRVIA